MKRLSTRGWVAVGSAGAFLFCLSLCAIVRSCELARMGHVSVVEADRAIWRSFYARSTPPGRYRMTQASPPVPGGYSFDTKVMPGLAWCGMLFYTWYPEAGAFSAGPGLTIACSGDGTYEATGPNGPVTGTCVFVGP